jgi:1-deoxy-D-xylulose-5-phosphate synthase
MNRYLDLVENPGHVKNLTLEQLQALAGEVREELITKLSINGGHLGPNLGVVELSIAMHKEFSTPTDKFVWDVSHQSYVHKLLTGRRKRFETIRTTNGLSGFALRTESEHDCYGAGHAGTALSAALGMAAARDLRGSDEHVVCVFGDAALTNGISFEALNNIAHTTKRFIAVLNDNEWSIAKNVGAIAHYLNKLITHPKYNQFQKDFLRLVRRMPKGEIAVKLAHKAEEGFKGALTKVGLQQVNEETIETDGRGGYGSSLIFEELGLRYLGPIDGHDLGLLIEALKFAKTCDHPIVLHVLTKKGKGFEAALKHPEQFHGLGPYDVETGAVIPPKPGSPPTYQDVLGQTVAKLAQKNFNIVGITAAMPSGTGMKALEKAAPRQYFDVGIAEEHAVIFAAGMATMGYRPVVAIYSSFMQRSYDCIMHDVALQDLPVMFAMDRAGLSASDGPTHHGVFDISYLRPLPNIISMAPSNEDEFVDMIHTAAQQNHPTFLRYPRGAGEGVPIKSEPRILEIGKAEVVQNFAQNGRQKVAIFGLGIMMNLARKAARELSQAGFDCALINPRFIKPLDVPAHEFFGRTADVIVTLEDHVLMGGYGSSVLETFNEKAIATPVIRIGWPDQFIEHASTVDYLRQKYGLTVENVVAKVKAELGGTPSNVVSALGASPSPVVVQR